MGISNKLNILMITMSMDIGGAETHILELCKGLAKMGHNVSLVSKGGIYVEELEKTGVRHIYAPLHRRSVSCILRSYRVLKKVILQEKPDIVHAHARIPGFICGLIRRKIPFEFVTTAHWVFETAGLQGKLTNWGQKTMAVSQDIKEYLLKNYDINERNIYVTINGIDTDRFSPDTCGERVRKELGLNGPTLVHVSRLDSGRAIVAGQLVESAERLTGEIEGLNIVITGGGNMFGHLSAMADEVNRRVGRKCVILTGPRTDINEIIATGTAFVGVSRAALEAMSVAKPVIVAGDEGYIGTFNADSFDVAWSTNFCCRGCERSTSERLSRDIAELMNASDDQRRTLGEYCRETVLENYSVAKMAGDYEKMYRSPVETPCKVLISGYYGYKNAGDDAILYSIKQSLRNLDVPVDISVLSHSKAKDRSIKEISLVQRFSIFGLIRAVARCDLLISGGGSLLQDKTSTRSLIYYLSVIRLAKFMDKKVIIYANGIGPVYRSGNRHRVRRAVLKADIITLREASSRNELVDMGVVRPDVHVTADPVFLLESTHKDEALEKLRKIGIYGERPVLGVSVRKLNIKDPFIHKMAELLDYAHDELGMDILFIIMQSPNDTKISQEVQAFMKAPSFMAGDKMSPQEIMAITGCMSLVISMRLHTIVFAAKEKIPVLGIECDPKISYYQDILGMPSLGRPQAIDLVHAREMLRNMTKNYDSYRETISHSAAEMEKAAAENEVYLKKVIDMCQPN